ncbi:serine/threonine-protein kinase [Roseisolibacter agri]|uniref:non-specific serine/threonine protein kinase n=1 Tax=Roseisolibacter agri TaxID=2014610 RepID=A0AA37V0B4_9BACT|nr:serine/threonine-protein kinase [Roseisolibacter agri]GLC24115.1 hypothetical protein rosag_06280 [Roseisolibacter agri]
MTDLLLDRVVAAIGDRFEIGDELGRGGMAVVYRAREVRLRRAVALKVLPPELAFRTGVRERFLREAQTAAQLTHPHIVPIYAADESGGVAWLAMALVDGETLGQRMQREGRVAPDVARRILAEVADALAYAHAHGVVHRDVKPDNILLDRDSGRATVTDFGIARAAEEELRLTVTGVAIGSPAYMSPEQAMGEAEVDGRSDQYSLAVVGYQLLTGELPFQASSATAMLMKHVAEAPRPIASLRPDVPPAMAAAIERALAKKPADRWPDASAFRRALLDTRAPAAPAAPAPMPDANGASTLPKPARPPAPAPGDPFTVIVPTVGARPAPEAPAAPPGPGQIPSVRDAMASAMRQVDRALADVGPLVHDAMDRARRGAVPVPPAAEPPARPPQTPTEWRASQKQAEREWKEHLRAQRREWRERQQEQQAQWKDHWRDAPAQGAAQGNLPVPLSRGEVPGNHPLGGMPMAGAPTRLPRVAVQSEALPPLSLERRAELFRRKAGSVMMLLAFLTLVNALHLFLPPWVLFPAFGMGRDLRRRWRPLRDEGLRFWELMFEGPQAAVAGAQVRPTRGRGAMQLQERARRFRRHVRRGAVSAVVSILSLIIGVNANVEPLVVPVILFGFLALYSAVGALRHGRRLRRAGVSLEGVMGRQWEELIATAEPRPRDEILAEEASRLVGSDVLASAYGSALRGALDDRLVVRETLGKLAPADRALIPDVLPTINALVERIAGLVQSLSRLEGDVRAGQVEELDARLARARAEPAGSPDRDRKISLLERQRASLADLAQRRATMLAQLENAQLVLQNMKLDLLKLRAAGVGALAEVTTATQEARALSRDIQYALDAAAEVRAR